MQHAHDNLLDTMQAGHNTDCARCGLVTMRTGHDAGWSRCGLVKVRTSHGADDVMWTGHNPNERIPNVRIPNGYDPEWIRS